MGDRLVEGRAGDARERRSPGLAALFDALAEDGRHSILELGAASGTHLRVLRAFARQIRFADLLIAVGAGASWADALASLPPNPERPYDVVLAWDVLDRLDPELRPGLVARLAAVTAARAWLYAVVGPEHEGGAGAVTYALLGRDRVSERRRDVTTLGTRPLLPAEMERALEPFEIVSAFMLRNGAREYVAVKRP